MTGGTVVDTNVLVAANGRATHVEASCQLRCVVALERLSREKVVCVDDKGLIMREYESSTRQKGQIRPGTAFFKHIWQKMGDTSSVRLIQVELVDKDDPEGRDFRDPALPPNNLKKDAKFLAVAVKANATILNATDSDWAEHRELTDQLGVAVRQLCPQHATRS